VLDRLKFLVEAGEPLAPAMFETLAASAHESFKKYQDDLEQRKGKLKTLLFHLSEWEDAYYNSVDYGYEVEGMPYPPLMPIWTDKFVQTAGWQCSENEPCMTEDEYRSGDERLRDREFDLSFANHKWEEQYWYKTEEKRIRQLQPLLQRTSERDQERSRKLTEKALQAKAAAEQASQNAAALCATLLADARNLWTVQPDVAADLKNYASS